MDKLTKKYRKSELDVVSDDPSPYKRTIQICGMGGEKTKHLGITESEFQEIKRLLLGGVKCL